MVWTMNSWFVNHRQYVDTRDMALSYLLICWSNDWAPLNKVGEQVEVSKLCFWPIFKFGPKQAQNRLPPCLLRRAPRARRNASMGDARLVRLLHARAALRLSAVACCSMGTAECGSSSPCAPQSFPTSSRPSLTLSRRSCAAELSWPPSTSSRAWAPAAAGCSRPILGPGVAMASRGQVAGCLLLRLATCPQKLLVMSLLE